MMTDTSSINWPQEKVEKLVGHYKEIGISQAQVSRLEKGALGKIKKAL